MSSDDEQDHNLKENTEYDCAICKEPTLVDPRMIVCYREIPRICAPCSTTAEAGLLPAVIVSAPTEVARLAKVLPPRVIPQKNRVTWGNPQNAAEERHQLERMRGELKPNLDCDAKSKYDGALCGDPVQPDQRMISCCRCYKAHLRKFAKIHAAGREIAWMCTKCSVVVSASSLPVVDISAASEVANSVSILSPHTNPQNDRVTWGNPQKDTELKHRLELEQSCEIQQKSLRRQLQWEKEMQEMQLQLDIEMQQMRQAMKAEFLQKRRQLYEEFGVRMPEQEEEAVGGLVPEQKSTDAESEQAVERKHCLFTTPYNVNLLGHVGNSSQQFCDSSQTFLPRNDRVSQSEAGEQRANPILPPVPNHSSMLHGPIEHHSSRPTLPQSSPPSGYSSGKPDLPQLESAELAETQITARDGQSAKLPPMRKPKRCTNLERLQESVEDRALVRSKQPLPKLVLMVYEEPGIYDHCESKNSLQPALLQKAEEVKFPHSENSRSSEIHGTVVKQKGDLSETVGLVYHPTTSFLIVKLLNGLSHTTRMRWVRYDRGNEVLLELLSKFNSAVVIRVSKAALIISFAETPAILKPNIIDPGFLNENVDAQSWAPSTGRQRNIDRAVHMLCRAGQQDYLDRYYVDFGETELSERKEAVDRCKLCPRNLYARGKTRYGFCGIGCYTERHYSLLQPLAVVVAKNPPLTFTAFSCDVHDSEARYPVIFRVSDIISGSKQKFVQHNVQMVQQLQSQEKIHLAKVMAGSQRLNGLSAADDQDGYPRILIGLEVHVCAPLGQPGEPIVFRSKLGWTKYSLRRNDEASTRFAGLYGVASSADRNLGQRLRISYFVKNSYLSVAVLADSNDGCSTRMLRTPEITDDDHIEASSLWQDDRPQYENCTPVAPQTLEQGTKLQPWVDHRLSTLPTSACFQRAKDERSRKQLGADVNEELRAHHLLYGTLFSVAPLIIARWTQTVRQIGNRSPLGHPTDAAAEQHINTSFTNNQHERVKNCHRKAARWFSDTRMKNRKLTRIKRRFIEFHPLPWQQRMGIQLHISNHHSKRLVHRQLLWVGDLLRYIAGRTRCATSSRSRLKQIVEDIAEKVRQAMEQPLEADKLKRPVNALVLTKFRGKSGQIHGPGPDLREEVCWRYWAHWPRTEHGCPPTTVTTNDRQVSNAEIEDHS